MKRLENAGLGSTFFSRVLDLYLECPTLFRVVDLYLECATDSSSVRLISLVSDIYLKCSTYYSNLIIVFPL
jgi:hypothetical protein